LKLNKDKLFQSIVSTPRKQVINFYSIKINDRKAQK